MASIRQRRVEQSPPSTGRAYNNSSSSIKTSNSSEDHYNDDERNNDDMSYYRTPRTLNMIPDKYYRDFMSKGGKSFERKKASFITGHACANLCIGFSYVGMAFMFWVGILTNTQPFFIKGLQPKDDGSEEGVTYNVTTENQKLPVTKHAYQACFAYFVTILLCKAYQNNFFSYCHARIRRMRRFQYQDIPDHNSDHHQLPMYFPSQKPKTQTKLMDVWNRILIWFQNNFKRTARNKRRRE